MSYVIQTENGLDITDVNPIDKIDSVQFSGTKEQCIAFIELV
jgi:hypothetical protein